MKMLPVERLTSFLREAEENGVYEMYYTNWQPASAEGNCWD